jgi:hypothetical protein
MLVFSIYTHKSNNTICDKKQAAKHDSTGHFLYNFNSLEKNVPCFSRHPLQDDRDITKSRNNDDKV